MFQPPYRWLPRTVWPNLCAMGWDLRSGVRNLVRWLPVIWFDRDYDWAYLVLLMETKLRMLADCMEHGHHVNGARDAKRARTCAALLKRLQADEYMENAGWRDGGLKAWKAIPAAQRTRIVDHAEAMGQQDQRYLGLMLGKYFRSWWD